PDQVAGGPPDPNEQGSWLVNSIIGSQWSPKVKTIERVALAAKKKDRDTTQMFVRLDVKTKTVAAGTSSPGKAKNKDEQKDAKKSEDGKDKQPDDDKTKDKP